MTIETTSEMNPSMRNVVARLTTVRLLTSPLPKFPESLTRKLTPEQLSPRTPNPISWPTYAADGQYAKMTDLLASRPSTKIVAIGEHHHQPAVLNLQLQLLDWLSSRHPQETVLVVEYFNLTHAKLLADFDSRKIDLPELASIYAESGENFDVVGHLAPLLLLAREKNLPIIPGFPPRAWTREFLQDRERVLARLKEKFSYDRPEDTRVKHFAHEAYLESLLSGDAPRETIPEGEVRKGARILPAQLLKDAVMAWAIDQQVARGKKVIVLAGVGHLEYRFGVIERVREARSEEVMLIVCKSKSESELWLHEERAHAAEKLQNHKQTTVDDRAIADAVYLYDAV